MSTLGKFLEQDGNGSSEALYQHFKSIPLLAIGKELVEFDQENWERDWAGVLRTALRRVFPEKYKEFLAIPDNKITLEHTDLLGEIDCWATERGKSPAGMLECQCKIVKIANRMNPYGFYEAQEMVKKEEEREIAAVIAQRKTR